MDNLFGAAAIPTPDTPLLLNDEAKATEIRAADDAIAIIIGGLASSDTPPHLVVTAGQQPLYTPPPAVTLETLNAMAPLPGAVTEASHERPGPVRRLLRFLMPTRGL